jgi:hypothetical protein
VFSKPAGRTFTARFQGTNAKLDSNARTDGTSGCFSIKDGSNRTTVDAGLR